jgi:hypothetical protein
MGDHVVEALVWAVANLETLYGDPYGLREAGNALEEVAYHLSHMDTDERQRFLDSVNRLASDEDDSVAANWIRRLPFALGVTQEPPTT